MAKNRKNQSAAIRFGPALKALFLCLLIAGSAVGYVWQKGQVHQLGTQFTEKERRLIQLESDNDKLEKQLADLRSPVKLDQRARDFGLVRAQPGQVHSLSEVPSTSTDDKNTLRQFATRPVAGTPR